MPTLCHKTWVIVFVILALYSSVQIDAQVIHSSHTENTSLSFMVSDDPQKPVSFPDSLVMQNKYLRVAVSPKAGRIVDFGEINGPNLLWINNSRILNNATKSPLDTIVYNVGGDRVLPTMQYFQRAAFGRMGNYPPDGVIDGQPWRLIEKSSRHIVMESPISPHLGVQLRRTIVLNDDDKQVKIINKMTRVVQNPFPVHLWSVTQVTMAQAGLTELADVRPPVPKTWIALSDDPIHTESIRVLNDQSAAVLMPTHTIPLKIGTFGRWVAGWYQNYIFMQCTEYQPDAAYADGSSAQVFSDIGQNYMELELVGPFVYLRVGESIENRIFWKILKSETNLSVDQAAHQVREQADLLLAK